MTKRFSGSLISRHLMEDLLDLTPRLNACLAEKPAFFQPENNLRSPVCQRVCFSRGCSLAPG